MSKDNTIRRMQDDAIIGCEGGIPIVETLNFHKPLQTASMIYQIIITGRPTYYQT